MSRYCVWNQKFLFFAFLMVLIVNVQASFAQGIRRSLQSIIHEAYLPAITDISPLETLNVQPPPPIQEKVPQQSDLSLQWIPGYWAWFPDQKDFIWVSGVWRRPPPGHKWISGYWGKFPEGWAFIKGFWSPLTEDRLNYLPLPPDSLQEDLSSPPDNDYFWDPGFWAYIPELRDYIWINGEWRLLDPNWMLVPAHYQWRENGYVFIPAFWDWPLEMRGKIFQAIPIIFENREDQIDYQPMEIFNPKYILETWLPYYPDYLYFYRHYLYFHPQVVYSLPFLPPWWNWPSWWALNWNNQWSVWWWYTHPGYPAPDWMTPTISRQLPPPSPDFLSAVSGVVPPSIVTALGVFSSHDLIQTMPPHKNDKDKQFPLIPSNVKWRQQWLNALKNVKNQPSLTLLRPSAQADYSPFNEQPQKPAPFPNFKTISGDQQRGSDHSSQERLQKYRQHIQMTRLPDKPMSPEIYQLQKKIDLLKERRGLQDVPQINKPLANHMIASQIQQRLQQQQQEALQQQLRQRQQIYQQALQQAFLEQANIQHQREEQRRLLQNSYPAYPQSAPLYNPSGFQIPSYLPSRPSSLFQQQREEQRRLFQDAYPAYPHSAPLYNPGEFPAPINPQSEIIRMQAQPFPYQGTHPSLLNLPDVQSERVRGQMEVHNQLTPLSRENPTPPYHQILSPQEVQRQQFLQEKSLEVISPEIEPEQVNPSLIR